MPVSVVDGTCEAAVPCLEDVGNVFVLPRLAAKGGTNRQISLNWVLM